MRWRMPSPTSASGSPNSISRRPGSSSSRASSPNAPTDRRRALERAGPVGEEAGRGRVMIDSFAEADYRALCNEKRIQAVLLGMKDPRLCGGGCIDDAMVAVLAHRRLFLSGLHARIGLRVNAFVSYAAAIGGWGDGTSPTPPHSAQKSEYGRSSREIGRAH